MERSARKEREFNMRRTEILAKAEKVFATKGFHNVTMAEIASTSGFSIGSLYQFFEGKENLYTTFFASPCLSIRLRSIWRWAGVNNGGLKKKKIVYSSFGRVMFVESKGAYLWPDKK